MIQIIPCCRFLHSKLRVFNNLLLALGAAQVPVYQPVFKPFEGIYISCSKHLSNYMSQFHIFSSLSKPVALITE